MCGICGVVNWEGPPDAEPVRAMSSTMVHRGPNADVLIIRPPAILAHRRLSIIDLSDGANQPMVDDSGRYSITFNGEIYNYRVLRTKLEGFGIRFRTQSDTEVLLNAYIAWGLECLQHLNGMLSLIHISEPTRLLSISYAVFCLKKKKKTMKKRQNYEKEINNNRLINESRRLTRKS